MLVLSAQVLTQEDVTRLCEQARRLHAPILLPPVRWLTEAVAISQRACLIHLEGSEPAKTA